MQGAANMQGWVAWLCQTCVQHLGVTQAGCPLSCLSREVVRKFGYILEPNPEEQITGESRP
jgi:hypothetical protein